VKGRPRDRSIRTRDFKLIWTPGAAGGELRLFALDADPEETRNLLADLEDDATSAFAQEALDTLQHGIPSAAAAPQAPIDDDTRERLRELGYLE
jgi:arylsulfatase A-like enzyme